MAIHVAAYTSKGFRKHGEAHLRLFISDSDERIKIWSVWDFNLNEDLDCIEQDTIMTRSKIDEFDEDKAKKLLEISRKSTAFYMDSYYTKIECSSEGIRRYLNMLPKQITDKFK